MFNLDVDEAGSNAVLRLDGDMGIERAQEIKTSLMEALNRSETLRIDLRHASGLSIAWWQLMLAANKSARKRNKRLLLMGGYSQEVGTFLEEAGLSGDSGAKDFFSDRGPA